MQKVIFDDIRNSLINKLVIFLKKCIYIIKKYSVNKHATENEDSESFRVDRFMVYLQLMSFFIKIMS
jgi:hypothetical protein